MPLIVEDGTGLANAEAYISAVNASAYHAARGNAAWAALATDALREQYLRLAVDYMQQAYRIRWAGSRTTTVQALDWPRSWVPQVDAPAPYRNYPGYILPNFIPAEVKNANCELALSAISGALAPAITRLKASVKVGPIDVTYDKDAPEYTRFRNVDMMLRIYLMGNAAMAYLTRA